MLTDFVCFENIFTFITKDRVIKAETLDSILRHIKCIINGLWVLIAKNIITIIQFAHPKMSLVCVVLLFDVLNHQKRKTSK